MTKVAEFYTTELLTLMKEKAAIQARIAQLDDFIQNQTRQNDPIYMALFTNKAQGMVNFQTPEGLSAYGFAPQNMQLPLEKFAGNKLDWRLSEATAFRIVGLLKTVKEDELRALNLKIQLEIVKLQPDIEINL